jgi:hypothetical protein
VTVLMSVSCRSLYHIFPNLLSGVDLLIPEELIHCLIPPTKDHLSDSLSVNKGQSLIPPYTLCGDL